MVEQSEPITESPRPLNLFVHARPPIFQSNATVVPSEPVNDAPMAGEQPVVLARMVSPVGEPIWRRVAFDVIAAIVVVGYFFIAMTYWVPAHGGVDQNGYLYGAKRLLDTGSMQVAPEDPYAFVGRMWVTGKVDGTFYPKYPIGLPFIYAIALGIGGIKLAYLVNPIAMTLGLVAAYLIVRRITRSSFYGLMGLIVVATSPVTTGLTNNPNSHATAFFTVAWGMYFLLRWWDSPTKGWTPWLCASLAGFLAGYAVTIRYTEGLLLLPMAIVAGFASWDAWRSRKGPALGHGFPVNTGQTEEVTEPVSELPETGWKESRLLQSLAMFGAWAVPVGALLLVNFAYFGSPTGYDPTHESTGFTWKDLTNNWDTMLRQFYMTGLMYVFPLAIIGLLVAFRQDFRKAMFTAAWAVPCLFIYTAYYWAPDSLAIGYSRFFLTIFPALAAAGMIAMKTLDEASFTERTMTARRLANISLATGIGGALLAVALVWKLKHGWPVGDPEAPAYFTTWSNAWRIGTAAGVGLVAGAVGVTALFVRPSALVVMAGVTLSFITCIVNFENDNRSMTVIKNGGDVIERNVPQGSTVFSKDTFAHYLQVVGNWNFYSIDMFNENAIRRLADQSEDLDMHQPFQAERALAMYELLKGDDNNKLAKRQNDLMDTALNANQRVFVVSTRNEWRNLQRRFMPDKVWDAKIVETWSEPMVRQNLQAGRWLNFNRPGRQNDRVNVWQLVEVTRKPPEPTKPAPATKPVAPPTPPKPVVPAPKPVAPAPKAVAPAPQPVVPETKPIAPATKPVVPTTRPNASATKPTSTTKPATTQAK